MSYMLEIKDLNKTFKTDVGKKPFQAVKNLNLRCQTGVCTGLLGHNGAGKTTTLKVVLGLISADSGEINFDGQKINRESRRYIGYMPEINRLPLTLSCYEILKLHTSLISNESSKVLKQKIEESLKEVGLWDHRHKLTKQLSKGMGRRLAWAQATIHKPKLLILDEPYSGLDPKGRRDMRLWIEAHKKTGTTILLCTHELAALTEQCERVTILKQGQVVYESQEQESLHSGTFEIYVAGAEIKILEKLRDDNQLSNWNGIEKHGYNVGLTVNGYENSSKWLKTLINSGMVVTNFKNSPALNETDALKYF